MNKMKPVRFLWRCTRNLLFPPDALAACFGRGDADYAWSVFSHHLAQLDAAGFKGADRILEIGPGRNLGTVLLWWSIISSRNENKPVEIVCWDIFKNAKPETDGFWKELAQILLAKAPEALRGDDLSHIRQRLREVADGHVTPPVVYRVEPLAKLEVRMIRSGHAFDLIYSQAAIEHIWHIDQFWDAMGRLNALNGWQSHRIDLADHVRRETNYVEMLEWSRLGYRPTMRFIPGAINRWRACRHLEKITALGTRIQRDHLPVPLGQVSPDFRQLGEAKLRTTALDVVMIKSGS
jgi:hypothetical protein